MRAVIQRVTRARVCVEGTTVGSIGPGLCILLGIAEDDSRETAQELAAKVARLRIFANDDGRLDLSALDTGASALVVSQFTLIADTTKGNRPSFTDAAEPSAARELYEHFAAELRALGVDVETGRFGATMTVEIANDGPVTLVVDR
ncbi:MAG: D-aminoacyl-tRNA deacylase [Gaiellaceae bacterium]